MPLLWISIAIALAGLGGAALFFGRNAARAIRVAPRLAPLRSLLAGKYFIDELYDRLLARPLFFISDRLFLRFGDRVLLDGTLDGLARLAQRTAGALGRVQTGNVHLYALFVAGGIVVALLWSFGHG